jgi:protein-S-isoprenylcysteine O-methyltransferase Ste14
MRAKNGEHPFGDAGQLILLVLFLILWAADSFFLRKSTFLSDYVPLYGRLIALAVTLVCAVCLSLSGHRVVSHEHPPTGVVSGGAFQYVRHPLYLASLLFYFGLVISTFCLFSFLFLFLMFFFYDYIASYEERILEERYGEDYLVYKERTGKWIPNLKTTVPNR